MPSISAPFLPLWQPRDPELSRNMNVTHLMLLTDVSRGATRRRAQQRHVSASSGPRKSRVTPCRAVTAVAVLACPNVVGTLPKLECRAWETVTDILSGFNSLFIPYFLLRELWEFFSGPVLLLESNEYAQSIRELPINAKLQDTQEVGRRISKPNEATEPTRSYTPLHGSRHCTALHATPVHATVHLCRAVQCRAVQRRAGS
ncbi:hypothetical protein C8F04DRAFT_1200672 [Mycena alexandri]|uniref:Uncharacterized protein n=1 Tax=Mycena alexandri TaxID=1745969 RepID=A0AAD6RZA6_9AGAR|nr:hypothetical protein C8F04DRAFT_1200672 [Mycena alexandri]